VFVKVFSEPDKGFLLHCRCTRSLRPILRANTLLFVNVAAEPVREESHHHYEQTTCPLESSANGRPVSVPAHRAGLYIRISVELAYIKDRAGSCDVGWLEHPPLVPYRSHRAPYRYITGPEHAFRSMFMRGLTGLTGPAPQGGGVPPGPGILLVLDRHRADTDHLHLLAPTCGQKKILCSSRK
jgi:hypothetical protein